MSITNLIKREIARWHLTQPREMVGLIDSWDPKEHAAKVKILTELDENGDPKITGWMRVRTNSAGGSSLCIGPKIGDQCTFTHHEGDPEAGIITGFLHNDEDRPPPVAAGEFIFQQPDGGGSIHIDAAGVATIKGKGGSSTVHDASGNVTHTDGSGGVIRQSGGKVYLGSASASNAVMLQSGASTSIFGV